MVRGKGYKNLKRPQKGPNELANILSLSRVDLFTVSLRPSRTVPAFRPSVPSVQTLSTSSVCSKIWAVLGTTWVLELERSGMLTGIMSSKDHAERP